MRQASLQVPGLVPGIRVGPGHRGCMSISLSRFRTLEVNLGSFVCPAGIPRNRLGGLGDIDSKFFLLPKFVA